MAFLQQYSAAEGFNAAIRFAGSVICPYHPAGGILFPTFQRVQRQSGDWAARL
jgi:hypothetical protein